MSWRRDMQRPTHRTWPRGLTSTGRAAVADGPRARAAQSSSPGMATLMSCGEGAFGSADFLDFFLALVAAGGAADDEDAAADDDVDAPAEGAPGSATHGARSTLVAAKPQCVKASPS